MTPSIAIPGWGALLLQPLAAILVFHCFKIRWLARLHALLSAHCLTDAGTFPPIQTALSLLALLVELIYLICPTK